MGTSALLLPMKSRTIIRRWFWPWLACLVLVLAAGTLVNLRIVWPWMSTWGATRQEQTNELPGDDLVPGANIQTTQGIAVQAGGQAIYPWLLQIGVDRGGMYSYDWLENLFGLRVHTVDHILPQYQDVQIGDFWRFTPPDYPLRPGPGLYVRELQPDRAVLLCFGMENQTDETCVGTWQFVLEPQSDGSTRLLLRSRMTMEPDQLIKLTYFVQFIMARKMLLEIRERAENMPA